MDLEITLELGRENPKLADFLYGLRCHSPNVEKLSRTKIGKRGVPVQTGSSSQGASHFTTNVEIEKVSPVLNLLIAGVLKLALGHDGSNAILSAYAGNLVLYSALGKILTDADGSQALGDTATLRRFKALHLKEDIWVAGVQTVDTNGRVRLAGFARDTAGKVLEAQGAGFDPMYVDPNGRYSPTAHESGHANLYPSGGVNTGQLGNTTTYWNVIGINSIWYKASGSFACERALSDTEVLRSIQSRSQAEEILTHETTKQWRHMPYDLKDKKGKKIICTCGKSAAQPCPEHRKEWEDRYIVNTGAQLEAAAWLVLELSADVRRLETQLANLQEEIEKKQGERR